MKKYYLNIILLLCLSTNAQTITFADPNFKVALLSATTENYIATRFDSNYGYYRSIKVDYNNDGEIQLNEALSIGGLNFSSFKNISSLSEINLFSNLEVLNCENNMLSVLDLSSLTKLKGLNCGFNQLTNLNVNGLKNLISLNFSNNQITNYININAFTNLQSLDCSNSKLSVLDVSALKNLQYLNCSNNNLSSLNLNGLLNLNYLLCGNNQVNTLNLDGLSNLININCEGNLLNSLSLNNLYNLEFLDCSNNLLKTLSFSGIITTARLKLICSNNQLSQLNIASLKNLFELSCQNNQLKTLDILYFGKLREINCSYNQLTTLIVNAQVEYSQVFLDCSNNALTSLYMYGNDINSLKCNNNLISSIDLHGDISYVDCSYNLLSSIDLSRLANLNKLYCQNNFITTLQIPTTPWYSSGFGNEINCSNNRLISLDLQNNKNEGVIDFSNNQNLKHICQDANQITSVKNLVTQYGYTNCIVDSSCLLSSESFSKNNEVLIYPNPVKEILNITNNPIIKISSITVFNTLGQTVLIKSNYKDFETIDVSFLKSGNFYVKVFTDKGIFISRFMKE